MSQDVATPSTLEVHDACTGEVPPTSVDLHVVLQGDRFFSGSAAFEKAEELRKLADAVSRLGVPITALALEGATIDVASGLFSRSSSVTYRVRIRLDELDALGGVLEVVSEAKKATLSHLEWIYDGGSEEEQALLQRAGARAVAKAKRLAAAVGAELGALRTVREEHQDEHAIPPPGAFGEPQARGRMSAATPSVSRELSGLELAPRKRVTVRVHLSYALRAG